MRWRTALALSALVVLAQIVRLSPLIDVVSGLTPSRVALDFPLTHIVFAPLTLVADWLNAGSRAELAGFFGWALAAYLGIRALARPRPGPGLDQRPSPWRESLYAAAFVLSLVSFAAWLVFLPRSIPRLVAAADELVVFDIHSHTSASRDGRKGFDIAANARWHQRAGFHAAFITDHNVFSAIRDSGAIRFLDGEELSLRGLHVIVLGNQQQIENAPWNDDWDSTLALLRQLSGVGRPYLIASLPEYWKHHWGPDVGLMVAAGIEGFEIWTTSPKAMEVPDSVRREVITRARLERLGLFGATDMHGIGHTAAVWNVAALPGWRVLSDSALTWALIGSFRSSAGESNDVVAMRRWLPASAAGKVFAVPMGLLTALRTASLSHAFALIVWIWFLAIPGRKTR